MRTSGLSWTGTLVLCLVAVILGSLAARQVRYDAADCERSGGRFVQVNLWTYHCER